MAAGVGTCLDKLQDLVRSRSAPFVVGLEHAHLQQQVRSMPCLLISVGVPAVAAAACCGNARHRNVHKCAVSLVQASLCHSEWSSSTAHPCSPLFAAPQTQSVTSPCVLLHQATPRRFFWKTTAM